ncbi:MAG: molybdopterin cofactor-binding domain-containing protein [Candidatus Velamenicoccus archaeovorus]
MFVDGAEHQVAVDPERSLLSVLRGDLGLTGPKEGCGEGVCGACTVLVDGRPVRACVSPVGEADGASITTAEGLAWGGALHPVQRAFAEIGAMQCGYCTPGMVVAAAALLGSSPHPDQAEIQDALQGNVCRCCTYPRIVRAVRRAAELLRTGQELHPAHNPLPELRPDETWSRPRRPWDLTDPGERDWFEVLPRGVVVLLPRGPGDGWFPDGGAWIHLGPDGAATAFTGKVDVGQGNRTALALRVARELGLQVQRVRVVMGDTDLCPFDPGTFGSRSMPDAGETLARVASGARDVLLRRAAERWGVPRSALQARDGCVRRADTGEALAYGELVGGGRRVEVLEEEAEPTVPAGDPAVVRPVPTAEALEAVVGIRRFPSDVVRPGMLHGAVLRPPAFGATLRTLSLEGAAAMPNVTLVHEGAFVGAAAPDEALARRAVGAVRAEWDRTPQPAEDELEAHLRSHPVEAHGWEGAVDERMGDPDGALADAEVTLSATYTTAYLAHVPLETRVAVAEWEGRRVTVWTGTQRPFAVRRELAEALDVVEEDVRVIVPPTGGGYGGKHTGEAAIEAARLARAAGRPVRVRWSREEEFTWAYARPAAVIDVRSGARRDGILTAWVFTNVNSGPAGIGCPYDIPHRRIRFEPAASPLRQGSYRALAATANHFARESHLDELAHELGADPLELRLRHLSDGRLAAVLRAAAEHVGWLGVGRRPGRGVGIAAGIEKEGRVATVAEVEIDAAGTVRVARLVTAFDCGAIVDPENLRNQIEGATVMGLGGALFERIRFGNGTIGNACLSAYRVPRFGDVPPIDVILLDRPDEPPAGAGETPLVAVAPAIANAIFAATGRRLRSLPLLPDGHLP